MDKVKAKKHLGQHFLKDEQVAKNIADTLQLKGYEDILEIGPGMGVLTKYMLEKPVTTYVVEIDTESVEYLELHYPKLHGKIIAKDFLKYDINEVFKDSLHSCCLVVTIAFSILCILVRRYSIKELLAHVSILLLAVMSYIISGNTDMFASILLVVLAWKLNIDDILLRTTNLILNTKL